MCVCVCVCVRACVRACVCVYHLYPASSACVVINIIITSFFGFALLPTRRKIRILTKNISKGGRKICDIIHVPVQLGLTEVHAHHQLVYVPETVDVP